MEQRVAIVTGAASGIGKATAERLAADGTTVVIADVDGRALLNLQEVLRTRGESSTAMEVDVAVRSDVEALVDTTAATFGRLDAMVANAGVGLERAFLDMSEEEIDRIIAVNLKGVIFCGQAAARAMIGGGRGGRIVNVSSAYAEVCAPNVSAYCASKAAVRMLTKAMALELGPHGIRVNAVAPGVIRTAMNPLTNPRRNAELETAIPLGYIGQPDDVASVIRFLLSADSSYVSGETILVDAGWTVWNDPPREPVRRNA